MTSAPPRAQPEPAPNQGRPRHLFHVFATFAVGGPQMRFSDIANHFGPRFQHTVLAMDGDYAAEALLDPSLDYHRAAVETIKGDTIGNLRRCRRALRRTQPDLLLTNNWGSIEWAMANRWPIVPQIHFEDGFGPEEADRQLKRRVWIRRLCLGHVKHVVVPSQRLYHIARTIWRLPEQQLKYLPNGIDCARFYRDAAKSKLQSFSIPQSGKTIIGTVAALRAEKNLVRLLHAFAPLAGHAHLVIAGAGGERSRLEKKALALQLTDSVTFTGHIEEPEHLLSQFDIFALSSNTEQMPLGVLEAMAAALPVAAVDVGDVKYMVSEPNKDFVSGLNAEALSVSLCQLVNNAGLRDCAGQENQKRVKAAFDRAIMLSEYEFLFTNSH